MKKVCVVIGGGSGMGKAVAYKFGEMGYTVLLAGRSQNKLEAAAEEIRKTGAEVFAFSCDSGSPDDMKKLAEKANGYGIIKTVVNAAGLLSSPDQMRSLYRTNILGTVNVTESFFPYIEEGSVMILFASMAGHFLPLNDELEKLYAKVNEADFLDACAAYSTDGMTAYSASKRFVLEYTKQNCRRFAEKGARIVSISPGTIETPMLDTAVDLMGADFAAAAVAGTPLGRLGRPEEAAELAAFLDSEKASYITGTDILIDGGFATKEHKNS